jgi:outer membrane protein TolC
VTKFPILVLFTAGLGAAASAAPLSLEQCVELALGASPEVKAASLSLDATQAKQWESWGNFLPRATYQVFSNQAQRDIYPYDSWDSLSRVSSAVGSQLTAADPYGAAALNALSQGLNSVTSDHMSGFGVGLVLPIDTSGKIWAASDLAGQQKDLAGVEYLRTREQMIFRVKKAFYQLWLAQKAVEVTQSSYDNLQRHVETAQSQQELGKISAFDVLRSRVQRDGVKPQLIAARNTVALAKLQLATLIHRDAGSFDIPSDQPAPAAAVPASGGAVETAYASRPEMRSTLLQTKMADSQIRLALADLLPTTALSIQLRGVSTTDVSVSKWLEADNRQWVAQLTVSGFLDAPTPARIAAANASAAAARQKLEAVRDQIRLDVEQALLNRQQSLEAVDATKASVELAQTAYDMAETRFVAGLATNLDVLDSRLALDQAQIGYYQSVAGAATADAALDLALGR